ncbi:hypothetical protein HKX48_006623 [Thoreauomyces humboldtii]|nr:hypothetical protein HKX48_006623 [Thoreauomyces humboldtii]
MGGHVSKHLPHRHAHASSPSASSSSSTTANSSDPPTESADRYRALASTAAASRNSCYERSKAAFASGDGALAKTLSNEGKAHASDMDRYNDLASRAAILEHNSNAKASSSSDNSGTDQIDLHGLFVKEALAALDKHVDRCRRAGVARTRVVTGKGNHSQGGVARIRPAVDAWCRERNLRATEDPRNAGVVELELDLKEGEEPGWFHRHGCIVM